FFPSAILQDSLRNAKTLQDRMLWIREGRPAALCCLRVASLRLTSTFPGSLAPTFSTVRFLGFFRWLFVALLVCHKSRILPQPRDSRAVGTAVVPSSRSGDGASKSWERRTIVGYPSAREGTDSRAAVACSHPCSHRGFGIEKRLEAPPGF